jgi:hypothetical protein
MLTGGARERREIGLITTRPTVVKEEVRSFA